MSEIYRAEGQRQISIHIIWSQGQSMTP